MARSPGSTADNTEKRITECKDALLSGISRAAVVRAMAKTYEVSPRTARRWVNAATADVYTDSTHQPHIETGFVAAVEKLELLSDEMQANGLIKEQIQCLKAVGQLYSQRLAAIERTTIQSKRISASLPF